MIENQKQYEAAKIRRDELDKKITIFFEGTNDPDIYKNIDYIRKEWELIVDAMNTYEAQNFIEVSSTNGKTLIPKRIHVLDKGFVEYIDHMGTDRTIVQVARTSYNGDMKGDEKDKKLLSYLVENHHDSPSEFCIATFRIYMPIFVRDQWVRSRTKSYSFRSFRYTEIDDSEVYYPESWRLQDNKNKQGSIGELSPNAKEAVEGYYEEHINRAFSTYYELLKIGVAREMARMVLPSSVYTMGMITTDLRNWLHFLDLRTDSHAQWEIRQYANVIRDYLKLLYPWTLELWEKKQNEKPPQGT